MTDPIVIKPTAAPLTDVPATATTHGAQALDSSDQNSATRKWLLSVAAAVALALLYAVFFVLPGMVSPADVIPRNIDDANASLTATTPAINSSQTDGTTPITPFRDVQLQRAKEQAEEELAAFVELQIELEETLQIATWGQTRYDEVKDLATRGDTHFVERNFAAALAAYRDATKALGDLRDRGEAEYKSAIEAGNAAIDDFNPLLAEREFNRALGYKAEDEAALKGLARTTNLPKIQQLLRQARQLARRGDTQAATQTYKEILAIDPETATVTDALAELSVAATNADFQDHLSRGFANLERKRYSSARAEFNAALKIKPKDAVAEGGLQQIAQETEVLNLRQLNASATNAVAKENWDEAVAAFDKALATDKNLEFAQAGRRDALERQRIARSMNIIITQSENLSDNKRMTQARALLEEAKALASAGPKWDAAVAEADALIQSYSQPVSVQLTSDNATQVTVYKVGRLGAFSTHNLSLRPGAYTIVGTADRCQDVRREIIVKPQMPTIDIRCENRL